MTLRMVKQPVTIMNTNIMRDMTAHMAESAMNEGLSYASIRNAKAFMDF